MSCRFSRNASRRPTSRSYYEEKRMVNFVCRNCARNHSRTFYCWRATPFDCVTVAIDAYEATLKEQAEVVEGGDKTKQAYDEMMQAYEDLGKELASLGKPEKMSPEKRAEAQAWAIETMLRCFLPNCVKVNYHRR